MAAQRSSYAAAALAWLVVLLGACVLPLLVSDYRTFQLTLALIYAIAILGLNILTGYNGQFSLGHGAFYGVGAFTSAILMVDYGWTFEVTIIASALLTGAFGLLVGVGLGMAREYGDPMVRNERDVEYYLGTTVLAQVPLVRSAATLRRCALLSGPTPKAYFM